MIRDRLIIYAAIVLMHCCCGGICVTSVSTEQYICNKLNSSIQWTCAKKSDCKLWLNEFASYKQNVECGLKHSTKERRVCCPQALHISNKTTADSIITTPNYRVKSSTVKTASSIVYEKCLDYAKFRFVNKTIHRKLLTDPEESFKMELDCVYITPLIVGGEAAREKEYPHMALIGYKEDLNEISWNCGGSLISEQFVMSAAHCTEPSILGKATWILLGMLSKEKFSSDLLNKNLFRIAQRFNHPEYKGPETENNDIALYKLEKPLTLSPSIRPTCLYTTTEIPLNYVRETIVTGWGVTGVGETESETLLKAAVNFLPNQLCEQTYKDERKYTSGFDAKTMVCAGHLAAAKDTCMGDSGGPLQVPLRAIPCMWTQIGITSFGSLFCGTHVPAIYTKVANYIPWIQGIVWP